MKITVQALIEGGKATPGAPLGPALGPLGVNIVQIIATINEKTKNFEGLKIPVKVIVDKGSKTFEVEVGTPPASALIKKELGIETGAKAKGEVVGNLTMEQVVKVAKMKGGVSLAKGMKATASEVLGTCVSMGVTCEGKSAKEVMKEVKEGKHDKLLS
ncbi:MAG: 50S ribosomal protein L11 [Candidatus Micrarchaeota archaeon]|nr:50S ribosomal protein L11 [Candidatus Micrarchaeota archaeon]